MVSIDPLHEFSAENNPGNVIKPLPLFALLLFISGPALCEDFDIEDRVQPQPISRSGLEGRDHPV